MSLKITRLRTHWTVEEADAMIMLLDELRDQLWETYREPIIEMRLSALPGTDPDPDSSAPPFDDPIEF